MQVTRGLWIGLAFALPPSLLLLAFLLWWAASWWLVGSFYLLCTVLVFELVMDAPDAGDLGIRDDD